MTDPLQDLILPDGPTIKIVVTSHRDYAPRTLPRLFASLALAGVPASDIRVTAGGNDVVTFSRHGNEPEIRFIEENLFDWTALFDLVLSDDLFLSDYWFFLPDTSEVGPEFVRKIRRFAGRPDGVRLTDKTRCGSNIGLYSAELLHSQESDILAFAQECESLSLVERKKRAILREDSLLIHGNIHHYQLLAEEQRHEVGHPYDGAPRTRFYYPGADLSRWKANFTSPDVPLILEP